jgi:hypothetical protein
LVGGVSQKPFQKLFLVGGGHFDGRL